MKRLSIFDIKTEEQYIKHKDNIDINDVNPAGENALITNDIEKVKWLLKYGIQVNNVTSNALHVFYLHENEPEIQNLLLEAGASLSIDIGLCPAAYIKDKEVLKLAISKGLNINYRDMSGNNSLYGNTRENCEILIEAGINVNNINDDGENIFFNISDETVDLFLGKIDINHRDHNGGNPAFFSNDPVALRKMIAAGLELNVIDNNGNNCLFRLSKPEIIEIMIKNGTNINHINNDGVNALGTCTNENEIQLAEVLLHNGIDVSIYSEKYLQEHFCEYTKKRIMEFRKIKEEKCLLEKALVAGNKGENSLKKRI